MNFKSVYKKYTPFSKSINKTTKMDTEISKATYDRIKSVFPLLDPKGEISKVDPDPQEVNEVVEIINQLNIKNYVTEIILLNIQTHLRQHTVPKFWSHFDPKCSNVQRFGTAVRGLYTNTLKYNPTICTLQALNRDKNYSALLQQYLHGTLLSQLPHTYSIMVTNFYEYCLPIFDEPQTAEGNCKACNCVVCKCEEIKTVFEDINHKLIELGLMERLVIQEVMNLMYRKIRSYIKDTCKNTYDKSFLDHFKNWLRTVVMSWLTRIYCGNEITSIEGVTDLEIRAKLESYEERLNQYLIESYLQTIIDQLFCVIIEYPDSQAILDDIRVCLPLTNLRGTLITKLQDALKLRLLHQGVSTPDILTAFIASIRALRRLDPTGVLLDSVTEPVRKYLRTRDDTVRNIVSSLADEGFSELADELIKGEALQLDDAYLSDDDDTDWESWVPDPIDADPNKTSKTRRTSDIISMLVNIFGGKELFVNEYRILLADRLLSQGACNTEKEIRYSELLKVRFGDAQLHYCEVMLKDICDSKRINSNLQNDQIYMEASKGFPANALILSAQFWPPFKEESFELYPEIKTQFDLYTKGFETLKGNRTLSWKPHLGYVDLEIEIENRTLTLNVSPIHATIIMHFQDKNKWQLEELCNTMKVTSTVMRRRLHFWQTHGIIREESPNCFILTEGGSNKSKPSSSMLGHDEEEMESALASAHDQREGELQVFWSYIVGMLTNLESMALDRIHQMLKMFVSEGPTAMECSMQELRQFLDGKVREHKLLVNGGVYRLPKN